MNRALTRVALLVALAGQGISSGAPAELKFLGDQNIPTGTKLGEVEFGGISGLVLDPQSGELLGISDDRSQKSPARFYRLSVQVAPASVAVAPLASVQLKVKGGGPFAPSSIDPEGIARTTGGRLFVSSEGDVEQSPRLKPAVYEFSAAGEWVAELPIPDVFLPDSKDPQQRGVRNNLGFEALTVSPDNQTLYTANEAALLQDGPAPDSAQGSPVRILELKLSSQGASAGRQFVYSLEAVRAPKGVPADGAIRGLTELISLGAGKFLSLERTWLPQAKRTFIQIHHADCAGATDVSRLPSLAKAMREKSVTPCRKRLVLDLDDLIVEGRLSKDFPSLDNLEGMAFGPALPSGGRTLVVIADNNFSATQRTQVLAFEWTGVGGPKPAPAPRASPTTRAP